MIRHLFLDIKKWSLSDVRYQITNMTDYEYYEDFIVYLVVLTSGSDLRNLCSRSTTSRNLSDLEFWESFQWHERWSLQGVSFDTWTDISLRADCHVRNFTSTSVSKIYLLRICQNSIEINATSVVSIMMRQSYYLISEQFCFLSDHYWYLHLHMRNDNNPEVVLSLSTSDRVSYPLLRLLQIMYSEILLSNVTKYHL